MSRQKISHENCDQSPDLPESPHIPAGSWQGIIHNIIKIKVRDYKVEIRMIAAYFAICPNILG